MKKLILLLIGITSLTSCQKHLTRENAKEIITKKEGYPLKENFKISKLYSENYKTEGPGATAIIGEDEFKEKIKIYEKFSSEQLLSFAKTPQQETVPTFFSTTTRSWTDVAVSLTEKGKKYLIGEDSKFYQVSLWETNIVEVTGIQEMEDKKNAIVNYTIANTNITPFGDVFSNKNNTVQKTAYFTLFDDGWRIQN